MIDIKSSKGAETANEFILALNKLNPTELIGVARIFSVKLVNEEEKDENGHALPREGADIVVDIVNGYLKLGRKGRRQLLKVVKQSGSK